MVSNDSPSPISAQAAEDDEDFRDEGRTRGSLKRERVANEKALAQLVQDLLALPADRWEKLGVPDATIDTLVDAKTIKSHGARARHARLIRSTLRNADWTLIRRRIDQFRSGYVLTALEEVESTPAQVWAEQLLVQGDAGLARFVEEFPEADRKRLRQLVRNTLRVPEAKRGKTRIQLERAVEIEVQRGKKEDSPL